MVWFWCCLPQYLRTVPPSQLPAQTRPWLLWWEDHLSRQRAPSGWCLFYWAAPLSERFQSHWLLLITSLTCSTLTGAHKITTTHTRHEINPWETEIRDYSWKTILSATKLVLRTKKASVFYKVLVFHFKLYLFLFQFSSIKIQVTILVSHKSYRNFRNTTKIQILKFTEDSIFLPQSKREVSQKRKALWYLLFPCNTY